LRSGCNTRNRSRHTIISDSLSNKDCDQMVQINQGEASWGSFEKSREKLRVFSPDTKSLKKKLDEQKSLNLKLRSSLIKQSMTSEATNAKLVNSMESLRERIS